MQKFSGEKARARRKALGLTMAAVAANMRQLGAGRASPALVRTLETGKTRRPRLDTAMVLAQALGLDLGDLLDGDLDFDGGDSLRRLDFAGS